jgi:hypothetical protein
MQCTHALEINADWAELILSGTKTVELRDWALPGAAVGRRVGLLAPTSPAGGAPGAPALAAHATLGPATPARMVGWARFGPPFRYESAAAAAADQARTRVPAGSPFLLAPPHRPPSAAPTLFWGWPVLAAGRADPPAPPPPGGRRLIRSLWVLSEE